LRQAESKGLAWLDLETAFRFRVPLKLSTAPRRVFLCCDPGWPSAEVDLFREVYAAAVDEGWRPREDESIPDAEASPSLPETVSEPVAKSEPVVEAEPAVAEEPAKEEAPSPSDEAQQSASPAAAPSDDRRAFAGAHYSGNMRDPRDRTWLALVLTNGERLELARLEPTGRSGLEARLRDPSPTLMQAEAIGLGFPFGFPLDFHEQLTGGGSAADDWWSLVKRVKHLTRPEFLGAAHEFLDAKGEVKRYTDEVAGTDSPLHRDQRDLPPMTYHGIRMIGGDRSRYAVRPFENAQARLLLEVSPDGVLRKLGLAGSGRKTILERFATLEHLPIDISPEFRKSCTDRDGALRAVLAARSAAMAVLSGESEKSPDELAVTEADRIRREGWIYGLTL